MPTVKPQDSFFVTFISAKGGVEEWTPQQLSMRALFTLTKVKKAAMNNTRELLDAGHGRVDWSFIINKAAWTLTSDPALYKFGVAEYGYVKGEEVYKFD